MTGITEKTLKIVHPTKNGIIKSNNKNFLTILVHRSFISLSKNQIHERLPIFTLHYHTIDAGYDF
jgi:hypothetical protein